MGLFRSKKSKVEVTESAQSKRAGTELEKRGTDTINGK